MARLARVVAAGLPHLVTQRGNRGQKVFFSNSDYELYLELLAEGAEGARTAVWAYALANSEQPLPRSEPDRHQ